MLSDFYRNDLENSSGILVAWAKRRGITLSDIQPGSPQLNAYVKRYNGTVCQECLGQHIFHSVEEAQYSAIERLQNHNNDRSYMGIGGLTPAQKLKTAA